MKVCKYQQEILKQKFSKYTSNSNKPAYVKLEDSIFISKDGISGMFCNDNEIYINLDKLRLLDKTEFAEDVGCECLVNTNISKCIDVCGVYTHLRQYVRPNGSFVYFNDKYFQYFENITDVRYKPGICFIYENGIKRGLICEAFVNQSSCNIIQEET